MRPTKNKPKKDKKNKFVVSPRPKKKINDTKQIKPKKIEISEDILLGRNDVFFIGFSTIETEKCGFHTVG